VDQFDKKSAAESFSFFSIYTMERIGPGNFALCYTNQHCLWCVLFIPAYRKTFVPEVSLLQVWVFTSEILLHGNCCGYSHIFQLYP